MEKRGNIVKKGNDVETNDVRLNFVNRKR